MALSRSTLAAIVAACTGLSTAVAAAPAPSQQQAEALQQQVQDWLTKATAGSMKVPPDAVQFTPEDDHYRVTVPLDSVGTVEPKDAALTARARMIDDTRWEIDDQKLPPSFRLTTKQTLPDPPDAKNPSPNHMHTETITYVVTIGDQTSHATFDPTYTTPTEQQSSVTSFDMHTEGASTPSTQHWDHYAGQASIHPTAPGRIDALSDTAIDGFHLTQSLPDGTEAKIVGRRIHLVGSMAGVEQDKLVPVINAAAIILKMASATSKLPETTAAKAAAMAGARSLLVAAHGLLTGGHIEETGEDVDFDFAGHTGSMAKVSLAFGGDAPQDMLSGTMTFGLDGLQVTELPPAFAAYLPKHILLTPTISNLSSIQLTKMAMDATAPGSSGTLPPGDTAALFSHGGIVVGLDKLALDIAGTQFAGTGSFTMTSPTAVTGQAEITAHGLDALITQAQADPMLAKGVPVIIFLKGIAHTTGDQSVWQIAVAKNKTTVNGVDLSALAGGMK